MYYFYLSFIFILAHIQDKYFYVHDVLLLDVIIVILPDILKEVASQGDLEEKREDEEAAADEQDTGQPETIVPPGETSVVENPREAGLSESHLERPLHLSKFSEEGSTKS